MLLLVVLAACRPEAPERTSRPVAPLPSTPDSGVGEETGIPGWPRDGRLDGLSARRTVQTWDCTPPPLPEPPMVDADCGSSDGVVSVGAWTGTDLAEALAVSEPGDVISLCGGTWEGSWELPAGRHLVGQGGPLLQAPQDQPALHILAGSTGTTVSSVRFEGDGLLLEPCSSAALHGITIQDPSIGLEADEARISVTGLTVDGGERPMWLRDSEVSLRAVTVTGAQQSLSISYPVGNVHLTDVHVEATAVGLEMRSAYMVAERVHVDAPLAMTLASSLLDGGELTTDGTVELQASHVVLDGASIVASTHANNVLLTLSGASTWAGGVLRPSVGQRAVAGDGVAERVYDTWLDGRDAVSSWIVGGDAVALIDSRVDGSADPEARHTLRGVELGSPSTFMGRQEVPLGEDGLAHLDCEAGTCAVPTPIPGIVQTEALAGVPGWGAILAATSYHLVHDDRLFHRETIDDPWVAVEEFAPRQVALEGDRLAATVTGEDLWIGTFEDGAWTLEEEALPVDKVPVQRLTLHQDELAVSLGRVEVGEAETVWIRGADGAWQGPTLFDTRFGAGLSNLAMDDRKVVVHRLEDHGFFEPYVIRVITVLERAPAGLVEVATASWDTYDGGALHQVPVSVHAAALETASRDVEGVLVDLDAQPIIQSVGVVPLPDTGFYRTPGALTGSRLVIGDPSTDGVWVANLGTGEAPTYLSRWDGIVGEEVGNTCAWAGEELLCSPRYDTSVISLRSPDGW